MKQLTVADLRAALLSLPDEMPVLVEQKCSEGCGVGTRMGDSCRVDDPDWPQNERLAFVLSDRQESQ